MDRNSNSGAFPMGNFLRRFSWIALEILAVVAFALPSAPAQENRANSLPPGVAIRADAIPPRATVGDLIQINLDVTLPPGYQAKILKPGSNTGDFSIVDFVPGPPQERHQQARITVAVYKTGTFVFPPLSVLLRTDKGIETEALSPSVGVEIQSVLTSTDQNLKDLKKQADISESRRWLFWIAALLAICLIAFLLWRIRRRRRVRPSLPTAPGGDPLEAAEADLRRLLARGLPEQGREKEFYILLSGTIKRIIEIGYRIHTAEQTTSEIMDSLQRSPEAKPENMEAIESFLVRCDTVKFAKYVPSKSEQEAACADALGLLNAVVSDSKSLPGIH